VIVVDASPNDLTRNVVKEFPGVMYLRNENGYGHMTMSRNIGLELATGDVIAFIDDDAFAKPGWAVELLRTYSGTNEVFGERIGAVGGRALNSGQFVTGVAETEIGRLKRNGFVVGNFSADLDKPIDVDHIIGCNMSFRREVLRELGGFWEDCTGTELGEETDLCLRVKRLGYRIVFNPKAVVDHVAAPQAKGKRFNARYGYYGHRNQLVVLTRNFGFFAPIVWRYLAASTGLHAYWCAKEAAKGVMILLANLAAAPVGLAAGLKIRLRYGKNPVRGDERGRRIAEALAAAGKAGAGGAARAFEGAGETQRIEDQSAGRSGEAPEAGAESLQPAAR
jgi:GT2 family glycosyltransferase